MNTQKRCLVPLELSATQEQHQQPLFPCLDAALDTGLPFSRPHKRATHTHILIRHGHGRVSALPRVELIQDAVAPALRLQKRGMLPRRTLLLTNSSRTRMISSNPSS